MFDEANKKNKSMLDTLVGARCAFGPPKWRLKPIVIIRNRHYMG
jgi:hypothetical protein